MSGNLRGWIVALLALLVAGCFESEKPIFTQAGDTSLFLEDKIVLVQKSNSDQQNLFLRRFGSSLNVYKTNSYSKHGFNLVYPNVSFHRIAFYDGGTIYVVQQKGTLTVRYAFVWRDKDDPNTLILLRDAEKAHPKAPEWFAKHCPIAGNVCHVASRNDLFLFAFMFIRPTLMRGEDIAGTDKLTISTVDAPSKIQADVSHRSKTLPDPMEAGQCSALWAIISGRADFKTRKTMTEKEKSWLDLAEKSERWAIVSAQAYGMPRGDVDFYIRRTNGMVRGVMSNKNDRDIYGQRLGKMISPCTRQFATNGPFSSEP